MVVALDVALMPQSASTARDDDGAPPTAKKHGRRQRKSQRKSNAKQPCTTSPVRSPATPSSTPTPRLGKRGPSGTTPRLDHKSESTGSATERSESAQSSRIRSFQKSELRGTPRSRTTTPRLVTTPREELLYGRGVVPPPPGSITATRREKDMSLDDLLSYNLGGGACRVRPTTHARAPPVDPLGFAYNAAGMRRSGFGSNPWADADPMEV